MTKPGLYRHYKGDFYTVLFVGHNSTNGPGNGFQVVVYVSLKTGQINVRDEAEFNAMLMNEVYGYVQRFIPVVSTRTE